MTPRRTLAPFVPAAALATVTVLVYARVFTNGPVWDDVDLTTGNPFLATFGGLWEALQRDLWRATAKEDPSSFYRPLVTLSYFVNRHLLGNTARSYHGVNLALHILNGGLVVALLRRAGRVTNPLALAAAGAAFLLLPVQVEAVAWIAGRYDLLGTAFVLGALLVNAGDAEERGAGGHPRHPWAAVALLVAAQLCKEAFVVGLPLLAMADRLLHGRRFKDTWPRYAALASGVLVFLLIRRAVGVMSIAVVTGTPLRSLAESYAFLLGTFAGLLLLPAYLDPFRPYAPPTALVALFVLVLAGFVVVAVVQRLRVAPRRPAMVTFGLALILVALGPVTVTGPNLLMVGDRYFYFPTVGAVMVLGASLQRMLHGARARRSVTLVTAAILGPLLVGWSLRDRRRLVDWRDEHTLFNASVRDDPDNAYALYSVGYLAAQEGRFAEADDVLKRSLSLDPRSFRTLNALCYVRMHTGDLHAAGGFCRASIDHQPENPRAWINLASVHLKAKAWPLCDDAAAHAAALRPRAAEPAYLRAACLANMGRIDEARGELRRCLALDPHHEAAQNLRGQFEHRGLWEPVAKPLPSP